MRRVTLAGTSLQVSRLSFGTSSLHHLPLSRWRQDLLSAAFECGFTHFDTSPYYGYGLAEEELARFVKGRQGRITIATKIGLYPPDGASSNLFSVWRRMAIGRVIPQYALPVVDWSPRVASKSLEASLRRLAVDTVDLLLLHDPISGLINSDAFLNWFEDERKKGRIRAWGLAGDGDEIKTWSSTGHRLGMVLQVRDALDAENIDAMRKCGQDPQITFGYLSAYAHDPAPLSPLEVIEKALRRNRAGSILVSTRKLDRVGRFAALAQRDNGEDH